MNYQKWINLRDLTQDKPDLGTERDIPENYQELLDWFPDHESCSVYLEKLRWPNGFICPACNAPADAWKQTRGRLVCPQCRHQTSVTRGTLFNKTHTPLTVWFQVIWLWGTGYGLTTRSLQQKLAIEKRTASNMLKKLRVAMICSEQKPLSGLVEIIALRDPDSFLDTKKQRTLSTRKDLIMIAVEIKDFTKFGRIRMRCISSSLDGEKLRFIYDVVSPGTTVLTKDLKEYAELEQKGYRHKKKPITDNDMSFPPHPIALIIDKWIEDMRKEQFNFEHLQANLDEFAFRFNNCAMDNSGFIFKKLLEQAVLTGPITDAQGARGY